MNVKCLEYSILSLKSLRRYVITSIKLTILSSCRSHLEQVWVWGKPSKDPQRFTRGVLCHSRSRALIVSNLSHPVSLNDILILSSTTPNLTSVLRPWSCPWTQRLSRSLVTWSIPLRTKPNLCDMHSLKNTNEVKNYPLPRPLSTYNSLIVLFPVTSESHSLWLVYFSRNLYCTM